MEKEIEIERERERERRGEGEGERESRRGVLTSSEMITNHNMKMNCILAYSAAAAAAPVSHQWNWKGNK